VLQELGDGRCYAKIGVERQIPDEAGKDPSWVCKKFHVL